MKKKIAYLVMAVFSGAVGVANAGDYYWGGGTGNWTDANWNGGAISDWTGHNAHIDGAGAVSITVPVVGTPSQIRMGASSGDVSLTIGSDVTGESFVVGDDGSGDATLTMTNGTANMSGYNYFGYKGTGQVEVNLNGGTMNITGANDYLTRYVDCVFNIDGGTYNSSAPNAYLSWNSTHHGIINLNSGTFRFSGASFLTGRYDSARGTINVNGGNFIANVSDRFVLGYGGGNLGVFNLTNGTVTADEGYFAVGYSGTGIVNQVGGTFVCTNANWMSIAHAAADSYGEMNLSGGLFDFASANYFLVGRNGLGKLTLTDNAELRLAAGNEFSVGRNGISEGVVSIADNASIQSDRNVFFGYYDGTAGSLTMTGGEFVQSTNATYFTVGRSGDASFDMSGGLIDSSAQKFTFGYYDVANVDAILSGGSIEFTGDWMYVGREGQAVLTQTGGSLETTGFILADKTTSTQAVYSISGGSFDASKYIFGHTAGAEFVVSGSGASKIEAGAVLFPAGTLTFQVDSNGCSRVDAVGGYKGRGIELNGATVKIEPLASFDPNDIKPGETLDIMWSANGFITEGMTFENLTSLNLAWDVVAKDGGEVFRLIVLKDAETVSDPVRVMSYNIYHGEATNGVIDLDLTVSVIGGASPDLVALQEVDNGTDRSGGINQAAYIAGQLGMDYRFGKAKDFQNGEFGVAILSKFPIVSDALYDLPDGSDSNSEHRVALEVQVDVPDIYGNTTTVSFVSTHLDQLSDDARVGQVNAIVNDLSGQIHSVILCGDLNATAESNSVQTLVDSGYLYQDRQLKSTFPATNAYKKIDFITVRTNEAPMASVPVFIGDNAEASDHLFVCTDIHLGAPAAWLASHGLAQDGLQGFVDSDEDGVNDYREWWYGTDPTDADEAFAVTGGGRVDATSKVKLVWMSAPQDTFTVERSTDLIYKNFVVIANGLPANAVSNRTEFIDNDSVTNQAAFYRVILE